MFYSFGNIPLVSTQGEATNPTSTVLLAEITGLGPSSVTPGFELYEGRVIVGASTLAVALVEHCLSSGLGSSALRSSGSAGELGQRVIYTPVMQSGQYMIRLRAFTGDRLRVRLSTTITGTAAATIILEPLT